MVGIQRLDDDWVFTLPSGTRFQRPWSDPCNVVLLPGPLPTLIDTGAPESFPALRAALDEAGLTPGCIRRVLLTGAERIHVGNLPRLENAVVFADDHPAIRAPARHLTRDGQRIARTARALMERVGSAEPTWSLDEVDALERGWADGVPDELDPFPIEEGLAIAAGNHTFTALRTPGASVAGATYRSHDDRLLVAGRLFDTTDEHALDEPAEYAEQLLRVSQFRPRYVVPIVGRVHAHPQVLFRSSNLTITNLLSNLQFVLTGTRNVEEVTWRDLGHRPASLLRYTAWVMRYRSLLDELHRAGIAGRSGDDLLPDYTIDIPGRLDGTERAEPGPAGGA